MTRVTLVIVLVTLAGFFAWRRSDVGQSTSRSAQHVPRGARVSPGSIPTATPAAAATAAAPAVGLAGDAALADRVLNLDLHGTERWRAVFALGERRAIAELGRVARAPFDAGGSRAPFEIRVRIHALAALDQLAADGADVSEPLIAVLRDQADDNLRMFATIALAGVEQQRPGKLNRFLNLIITQETF